MKQIKIKQFGVLLLGLSMALMMSCSKDEEVNVVDNGEPIVHNMNQELTGEFEGEWTCSEISSSRGRIMVNERYVIIDELPAENILKSIIFMVYDVDPDTKAKIIDSIGNIFFASSYEYPVTDLQIRYELGEYSVTNGMYYASASSVKNMLSDLTTQFVNDHETIVIGPPEPNSISFVVKADGQRYRIDLISKDHDVDMEFLMKQQWDGTPAGLWIIQYWFSTYRVVNLQTGQQFDLSPIFSGHRMNQGKADTMQLIFNASQRISGSHGNVAYY